jgi:GntR family histidine utilization transcriptional repressor
VHFENDRPIQLEERYVLPKLAPDYLKVDFTRPRPYDYLSRSPRLQEAEHLLRAVMPDERTRKLLAMKRDEPCLVDDSPHLDRRADRLGGPSLLSRLPV